MWKEKKNKVITGKSHPYLTGGGLEMTTPVVRDEKTIQNFIEIILT